MATLRVIADSEDEDASLSEVSPVKGGSEGFGEGKGLEGSSGLRVGTGSTGAYTQFD
jgi:hypothetical protein